jgi:hypothetical protein
MPVISRKVGEYAEQDSNSPIKSGESSLKAKKSSELPHFPEKMGARQVSHRFVPGFLRKNVLSQ